MVLDSKKILDEFEDLKKRYKEIKAAYDGDCILNELEEYKKITLDKDFWLDKEKAQGVLKQISTIEKQISDWSTLDDSYDEVAIFISMIDRDSDIDDDISMYMDKFRSTLNKMELLNLLNSSDDKRDAILTIHSGAGGTDSQDWANMLFRMYSRWSESNNYSSSVLSFQDGDEAGVKEVSLEIKGLYSYGYLKSEIGIHRLVRISPFNSNSKRHTSFASVFVSPILDDEVVIDINDKDIKIDTYRASGAGGQHVNKTDSAVRITHIPTGITVQCQNQRSQLNNKNNALKMLKSRLYQKHIEDMENKKNQLSSAKKDIAWGSQIRSYVFHPYNMVKDHRTKHETASVDKVMDGDIDMFIRAYLLHQMENSNE